MLDWIADNKILTALAILSGISGINCTVIITYGIRWVKNFSKEKIDTDSTASVQKLGIQVISTKNDDSMPNPINYRNDYGYTVFEAKEHDAERNDYATLMALLGTSSLCFFIAMLVGFLARVDQNYLGIFLMLPPILASYPLALWLCRRLYFIINNRSGNVYYFNRGIVIKLKTIKIDVDAEQTELTKWLPRLIINRQIIAEGDKVDTKEAAYARFNNDGQELSRITNGELRWTSWEWNERRKRLDAVGKKFQAFFAFLQKIT